ncbi:MAG: DUF4340 domain-containing protein [Nitrospirales bacterium]|nr:DUF4340 domain-containing protein [Nitrospirales bacterium]
MVAMSAYRTTMLLAFVCGGLALYLYGIDRPKIEQSVMQEIAEQRILPFDYRDVTTFTVKNRATSVTLEKGEDERWVIRNPLVARADSREVGNVLRALELGRVTRKIDDPDQGLEEYGLMSPHMTIALTAGNRTETLSLGDIAPVSSTLYVKRHSDEQVLLTTLGVKDFRKKSLFTFRKKEILSFNRVSIDHMTLQFGQQEFVLSRITATHGLTGDWQFQSPAKKPADKTTIGLLLMTLEDLTAEEFIDPGPERNRLEKELGLPSFAVTLGAGKRSYHMQVFHREKTGKVYAIRSPQGPIYGINPAVLRVLPQNPFDIQDRRLLGMKPEDIVLLSVKSPNTQYTLVQQHEEWIMDSHPTSRLDQKAIRLFASRVADLRAEQRVLEKDQNDDAALGLSPPVIEIMATDRYGREQGQLFIGNREKGLIYVKGTGLAGTYQARSLLLTQIPNQETLLIE